MPLALRAISLDQYPEYSPMPLPAARRNHPSRVRSQSAPYEQGPRKSFHGQPTLPYSSVQARDGCTSRKAGPSGIRAHDRISMTITVINASLARWRLVSEKPGLKSVSAANEPSDDTLKKDATQTKDLVLMSRPPIVPAGELPRVVDSADMRDAVEIAGLTSKAQEAVDSGCCPIARPYTSPADDAVARNRVPVDDAALATAQPVTAGVAGALDNRHDCGAPQPPSATAEGLMSDESLVSDILDDLARFAYASSAAPDNAPLGPLLASGAQFAFGDMQDMSASPTAHPTVAHPFEAAPVAPVGPDKPELAVLIPDGNERAGWLDSDGEATTPLPLTPESADDETCVFFIGDDSAGEDASEPFIAYDCEDIACDQTFVDESADESAVEDMPSPAVVLGYNSLDTAPPSSSFEAVEFEQGREHIWDFSMLDCDLEHLEEEELSHTNPAGLATIAEEEVECNSFWGSSGKPVCDISQNIFETNFMPILEESCGEPNALACDSTVPVEVAHILPTQHWRHDFGPCVPSIEVSPPPADYATLSDHPPHEVTPVQDEAWGMQLAVVGTGRIAWRPSVVPMTSSYMLLEHGVWRKARCYRESISTVLNWWIEDDDGQLRPTRPRDIQL